MVSSKVHRTRSLRARLGVRRLVAGVAMAGLCTPAFLALPQSAGAATSGNSHPAAGTSITSSLQQVVVEIEGVVFLLEEVVTCFNPCIVR